MKLSKLFIVFTFLLYSCEERFAQKKYDTLFTIKNTTDEIVQLNVDEINGRKSWEKSVAPGEVYELRFNIKQEINVPEGGFIVKATFPDGDSVELNTGYYTHFQMGLKNDWYFDITREEINAE